MSILIADSGGTKTDWAIVQNGVDPIFYTGKGLNPNANPEETFKDLFQNELESLPLAKTPQAVYFYGAGCRQKSRIAQVGTLLKNAFPNSKIEISEDLLAIAHAGLGNKAGWVAILGTGSNVAYYDSVSFSVLPPNLGYVLGDEGSGADIGKRFLRAALMGQLPKAIVGQLFPEPVEQLIPSLYASENQQHFLASFCPKIAQVQDNPVVKTLLRKAFYDFVALYMAPYAPSGTNSVVFTGSVALHFSSLLEDVLADFGLVIEQQIPRPIEKLVDYHLMLSHS